MMWVAAFQFTRPRGARHDLYAVGVTDVCFNSRAHGGRDLGIVRQMAMSEVSIHAPTGGATKRAQGPPPRNAFQFTRPRGARRIRDNARARTLVVSIHAPTGGATPPRRRTRSRRSFNSRAHGGRDSRLACVARRRDGFQFTRPRGARRALLDELLGQRRFQFTRPRGARQAVVADRPVD